MVSDLSLIQQLKPIKEKLISAIDTDEALCRRCIADTAQEALQDVGESLSATDNDDLSHKKVIIQEIRTAFTGKTICQKDRIAVLFKKYVPLVDVFIDIVFSPNGEHDAANLLPLLRNDTIGSLCTQIIEGSGYSQKMHLLQRLLQATNNNAIFFDNLLAVVGSCPTTARMISATLPSIEQLLPEQKNTTIAIVWRRIILLSNLYTTPLTQQENANCMVWHSVADDFTNVVSPDKQTQLLLNLFSFLGTEESSDALLRIDNSFLLRSIQKLTRDQRATFAQNVLARYLLVVDRISFSSTNPAATLILELFSCLSEDQKTIFASQYLDKMLALDLDGKDDFYLKDFAALAMTLHSKISDEAQKRKIIAILNAKIQNPAMLYHLINLDVNKISFVKWIYDQLPDPEKAALRSAIFQSYAVVITLSGGHTGYMLLRTLLSPVNPYTIDVFSFVKELLDEGSDVEINQLMDSFLQVMLLAEDQLTQTNNLQRLIQPDGFYCKHHATEFLYILTNKMSQDPIPVFTRLLTGLLQKTKAKEAPILSMPSVDFGVQLLDRMLAVLPDKSALAEAVIGACEQNTDTFIEKLSNKQNAEFFKRIFDQLSSERKKTFANNVIKHLTLPYNILGTTFAQALMEEEGAKFVAEIFGLASEENQKKLAKLFTATSVHRCTYEHPLKSTNGALLLGTLVIKAQLFTHVIRSVVDYTNSKNTRNVVAFFDRIWAENNSTCKKAVFERVLLEQNIYENVGSAGTIYNFSVLYLIFISGVDGREFIKKLFRDASKDQKHELVCNLIKYVQANIIGTYGVPPINVAEYLDVIPEQEKGCFLEAIFQTITKADTRTVMKKKWKRYLPFVLSILERVTEEKRDSYVHDFLTAILKPDFVNQFLQDSDWQALIRGILTVASTKERASIFTLIGKFVLAADPATQYYLVSHPEFLTTILEILSPFDRSLLINLLTDCLCSNTQIATTLAAIQQASGAIFIRRYLIEQNPRRQEVVANLIAELENNVALHEACFTNTSTLEFILWVATQPEGAHVKDVVVAHLCSNPEIFSLAVQDEELILFTAIPEAFDVLHEQIFEELQQNPEFLHKCLCKREFWGEIRKCLAEIPNPQKQEFALKIMGTAVWTNNNRLPLYSILNNAEGIALIYDLENIIGERGFVGNEAHFPSFASWLAQSLVIGSASKPIFAAVSSAAGREVIQRVSSLIPNRQFNLAQALLAKENGVANLTTVMQESDGVQLVESVFQSLPENTSSELQESLVALCTLQYAENTTLLDSPFLKEAPFLPKLLSFALQKKLISAVQTFMRHGVVLTPLKTEVVEKLPPNKVLEAYLPFDQIEDVMLSPHYALVEDHLKDEWFASRYMNIFPAPSISLSDEVWNLKHKYKNSNVKGIEHILSCITNKTAVLGVPHDDNERRKFYAQLEALLKHIFDTLQSKTEFAETILAQLNEAGSVCGERWIGEAVSIYQELCDPKMQETDKAGKFKCYLQLLRMREEILTGIINRHMQRRTIPHGMEVHYFDNYLRFFNPLFGIPNYFVTRDQILDTEFSEEEIAEIKAEFSASYNPATILIRMREWMRDRNPIDFVINAHPNVALGDILNEMTGLPQSKALAFWLCNIGVLQNKTS